MLNLGLGLDLTSTAILSTYAQGPTVEVNILIIGQSLAVGLYKSTDTSSTGGIDEMLSVLNNNTTGLIFKHIEAADGGTYVSLYSNPAGDAWWDDTTLTEVPAQILLNAISAVTASGKTPDIVFIGIGEAESNRIAEGVVDVSGDAQLQDHFNGWDTAGNLIAKILPDGSAAITDDDITSLGLYRPPVDVVLGNTVTFDIVVHKTATSQYPTIRMLASQGSHYVIFDASTGAVTRIIGSITESPAVGETFDSCDADGVLNKRGGWFRVIVSMVSTATESTTHRFYPAYSVNGTTVNSSSETGTLIIRNPNHTFTPAAYNVKPKVKSAYLSIFNHIRGLYGNIPCVMQTIGRREASPGLPWSNVGGASLSRIIPKELAQEHSWIYDGGEIYDYDLIDQVHGTDPSYVRGGNRHGRAIAAQLYDADIAYTGPTATNVVLAGDVIEVTTTPEDGALYHADMGHDGSGVATLTPDATHVSYARVFVNGVDAFPTAVTHNDESHATKPNTLVLTFASGTFDVAGIIEFYYMFDVGVYYTGSVYLNVDPTKVVKDVNDLPMRTSYWVSYGDEFSTTDTYFNNDYVDEGYTT